LKHLKYRPIQCWDKSSLKKNEVSLTSFIS